MVTVANLLSLPVFDTFRLITDKSGLHNSVVSTGIYEWETGDDFNSAFNPGDFVITTLSKAEGNPEQAESIMRGLIKTRVAAIAVKDICFTEFSKELIAFANSNRVPVFLFSETFFDDIIYTIRRTLDFDDLNTNLMQKLDYMLFAEINENEIEIAAKEINPFFHNDLICAFCGPKHQDPEIRKDVLKNYAAYYAKLTRLQVPTDAVYSLIRLNNGIMIILSGTAETGDLRSALLSLIESLEIPREDFAIGISDVKDELYLLPVAVKESLYAVVTCLIDREPQMDFSKIGLDQFLCPLRNNLWVRNQYQPMLKALQDYDEEHSTLLFPTLIEYVKSDGDISLTAEKLFQHSNTIRYRLNRIREILDIGDSLDIYSRLYIFVRLYEINHVLRDTRL